MFWRTTMTLSALLITGCSSLAWSRPGTSEAEFYQDYSACEQRAASMYPSPQQQSQSYQTNCSSYGNQTNCTSKPSPYQTQTIDMSISQRASAIESCMRGKGYTRGGGN